MQSKPASQENSTEKSYFEKKKCAPQPISNGKVCEILSVDHLPVGPTRT